jgi:hypothetical protein
MNLQDLAQRLDDTCNKSSIARTAGETTGLDVGDAICRDSVIHFLLS